MKKSNYILLFTFFLIFNLIQAQEEKVSKFNIIAYGGISYGIVKNANEPNYNLNTNNAELLLNYKISQAFGVATGIGFNELSGNGFNSVGNFYNERTLIKITLLLTMNSKMSENFTLFENFGFYGQNLIKDGYRYIDNTQIDIYEG